MTVLTTLSRKMSSPEYARTAVSLYLISVLPVQSEISKRTAKLSVSSVFWPQDMREHSGSVVECLTRD